MILSLKVRTMLEALLHLATFEASSQIVATETLEENNSKY